MLEVVFEGASKVAGDISFTHGGARACEISVVEPFGEAAERDLGAECFELSDDVLIAEGVGADEDFSDDTDPWFWRRTVYGDFFELGAADLITGVQVRNLRKA